MWVTIPKKAGKEMNTNVVLTTFEKEALIRLSLTNEDWAILNEVLHSDIYGKTIYEKEIEKDDELIIQKNTFLAMNWGYKLESGKYANVTIVIVDDKRFYLSLAIYNRETKENEGDALFVNGLYLQQKILSKMTGSFMTDEQVKEEVDALAVFGA